MNINLSGPGSHKKRKKASGSSLGFGLNKRKKGSNVFDEDDDDSDNNDASNNNNKTNHRDAVNREIAAEQAALRQRAQKAMSNANDNNVYDYDGAYDSFQPKKEETASKKEEGEKKSRYIQDLLQQSQKRAIERDAIYERKVAREQAQEDAQADFRGKEKFVTKAYQRKLEERKRLAEQEEEQRKAEEREDVTKKTGGVAFANFYGNLNRNVAMGGSSAGGGNSVGESNKNNKITNHDQENSQNINSKQLEDELGFSMADFERAGATSSDSNKAKEEQDPSDLQREQETKQEAPKQIVDPVAHQLALRKAREEKVAEARIRYFQRNNISVSS